MGKKQDNDWKQLGSNLSSSTSIRKYLDLCRDWYISNDNEIESVPQYCNISPNLNAVRETSLGLFDTDIRNVNEFNCYSCSSFVSGENAKIALANPFTRAQFMILCAECSIKINSHR